MSEQSWHLDKKVPVSLILALVGQTAVLIWWGATMQARVESLEHQIEQHANTAAHGTVREELAAISARQDIILSRQDMILSTLDALSRQIE